MRRVKLIKNFSSREYQQDIFINSLEKNTLVVLPTGLGKTVIALMLSVYYFNKFEGKKKILFLAPTKPLVEQQQISFENFFENKEEFSFQTLTGQIQPSKREDLYKKNDFIFSTPQLIENDIINNLINLNDFCLIIIDEAHRATGNYSYCFIAEQFDKKNSKILALTASPGTSLEQIKEVMNNLKISNIEVKSYEDKDVKPYVNKTKIDYVKVELPKNFIEIKELLTAVYVERLERLKKLGFLKNKNLNQITKTDLLLLQSEIRDSISRGEGDEISWSSISLVAGLMKLQYGQELFETQEISSAYLYFHNFFREGRDSSKAAQELITDIDFRSAYEKLSKLYKEDIKHPKLLKLKEIVYNEFIKNSNLKLIIFSQYRDSAEKIVRELSSVKEIRPALFVGQAKKGDFKLSQKEQKKVLDEFRAENGFNVLVSTSVGEEGLDIPKVDLVIFYEPVPSAIRTIQRIGRTGRFNKGNAIIMQTLATRDIVTRFVADAKERKMYFSLKKIKEEISKIKQEKKSDLTSFFEKKNINTESYENISNNFKTNFNNKKEENSQKEEKKESEVKEENEQKEEKKRNNTLSNTSNNSLSEKSNYKIEINEKFDDRLLIYVDNRENNDLMKELFNIDDLLVKAKKLEVGDIVISEEIGIERKSKLDFVNSIIDKRLFEQLINLAKNFKRPLLIIEGEENIYSIRNLNPNVILSTLSAIAIDLRIPILYTNSKEETAKLILTIAKRNKKDKKEISLAGDKRSISEAQELEKFVSSIPKINVMTAKNILFKFKTIKKLVNSSKEEIEKTDGVGKLRAKFLHDFFRREYK